MNAKYIVVIVILLGLGVFLLKDQILNTAPASIQPTPEVASDATTIPTTAEGSSAATEVEETMITLTASGFSPANLTVKVGTKVTFVNSSGSSATVDSDPHPAHTSFPALNLGSFKDGDTLSFTFDRAGTYGYHNHLKATQKGTVIVQ